jgi:hypothetical protein
MGLYPVILTYAGWKGASRLRRSGTYGKALRKQRDNYWRHVAKSRLRIGTLDRLTGQLYLDFGILADVPRSFIAPVEWAQSCSSGDSALAMPRLFYPLMSSVSPELQRRARRFAPCLPTPAKKPPAGPGWIHEIKHDGSRIVAYRDGDRVLLVTRNGFDFADSSALLSSVASFAPELLTRR